MSELKDDLSSMITVLGKRWKKAKRGADSNDRVSYRSYIRLRENKYRDLIRDVAFRVMEKAYNKTTSNGRYICNARQLYYSARPDILNETGRADFKSNYFTQTLLKGYMEEKQPAWAANVVWDARGHLNEPHTNKTIGLGGVDVRKYISEFTDDSFDLTPGFNIEKRIETKGPELRYGAVLFIEKEGFDELLEEEKIAKKYDIAICSTKGLPVSALCDLACKLKELGRPIYVMHDFDKSGFSILGSLRRGTRGSVGTGMIIDLGLRLEDIQGLEREPVTYRMNGDKVIENLQENGATKEEIQILVKERWYKHCEGERVELNAMTSEQLITWLERKLQSAGVKKLIPQVPILENAYKRAVFLRRLLDKEEELIEEINEESIDVPSGLEKSIQKLLKKSPELSWDEAVWEEAKRLKCREVVRP